MDPLWIDFANSEARDPLGRGRDEDRLDRPGWLDAFLERWKLPPVEAGGPAARRALRELRSVIRRSAERIAAGRGVTGRDLAALDRALRAQPVVARLLRERGRLRIEFVPAAAGPDGVIHAIARSFAEFLCAQDTARLRLCGNPDCRWIFYDSTRSRTRRWCAHSCGNLMKVRRFRERRRPAERSA